MKTILLHFASPLNVGFNTDSNQIDIKAIKFTAIFKANVADRKQFREQNTNIYI